MSGRLDLRQDSHEPNPAWEMERRAHSKALTERDELRAIGDRMQSEASRLAEFLRREYPSHRWDALPYEVGMALLEVESAIKDWTEERRHA